MEAHEASSLFPLMANGEYRALVDDIRVNGLREPIVIADGKVLDGRNRLRACEELGIEPRTRTFSRTVDGSLVDYVVSLNLHRRHLTPSQAAAVAFSLEPWYASEAKRRQVELAGTRPNIKPDLSANLHEGKGKAAEHAAAAVGAGSRYVQEVKRIAQAAPELVDQIRDGKITLKGAKCEIERARTAELATAVQPVTGTYRTICIDPPWSNTDSGVKDPIGRGNPVYATLTVEDMARLPIGDLSDPEGCHLYLWVTNRTVGHGISLLKSWGFRYVTMITWCKNALGVGHYYRNNTEHILFGVRGSLMLARADVGTWFVASRQGPHSTKPAEFYTLVESCSPAPRLEMFARGTGRDNWTVWGAEVEPPTV
jgi:N6-adenosine-specific RNA methylase IME4